MICKKCQTGEFPILKFIKVMSTNFYSLKHMHTSRDSALEGLYTEAYKLA